MKVACIDPSRSLGDHPLKRGIVTAKGRGTLIRQLAQGT
jgi:hypothetical protein